MRGTLKEINSGEEAYVTIVDEEGNEYQLFLNDDTLRTTIQKPSSQAKGGAKGGSKSSSSISAGEPSVTTGAAQVDDDACLKIGKHHTFAVGASVSFRADRDDIVTWIAPAHFNPPTPSYTEVLEQYLRQDDFSKIHERVHCPEHVQWKCPHCNRTQPFQAGANQRCSRCQQPYPTAPEFVPEWTTSDDSAVLTFIPLKWECGNAKCKSRHLWFAASSKPATNKCPCGWERPPVESVAYKRWMDHGDDRARAYCECYTPTGVKIQSKVDLQKLIASGNHMSVMDIIAQGDQDFVNSSAKYINKSCPHCLELIMVEKGCRHASLTQIKRVSFSEWYGLTQGDPRFPPRSSQLKLLLDNIPPCCCSDSHKGIGAVPKAPFNVFCMPESPIDQDNKYWNGPAVGLVTENRPLDIGLGFDVITNADKSMRCHIVPRSAGGCFVNVKNVIFIQHLCATCQCLDALFTLWQGENAEYNADKYYKAWVEDPKKAKEKEREGEIRKLIALFPK